MTSDLTPATAWAPEVVRQDTGGAVLVVDFSVLTGGRDAVDVAADAFPGRTILRLDPVVALEGDRGLIALEEMAARVNAGLEAGNWAPDVVVGYCSASPLAMLVAECNADTPPMILVAPGFPTWAHVEAELAEILQTMKVIPRADPLPRDPAAAIGQIESTIDSSLADAVADMGLGPEEVTALAGELGARYKSWLGFLISATVADVPAITTDLCVMEMAESWAAPHGGWPSHAQRLTTDLPRAGILDSEQVVELLRLAGEELL